MDSEWQYVIRKNRPTKCTIQKKNIDRDSVCEKINLVFTQIQESIKTPESVMLFGSVARGTNTKNSDIDILVIWKPKHLPDTELLYDLRNALIKELGVKVDLVVMEYIGKYTEPNESDKPFIENVFTEAIIVQGDEKHIINMSRKLGKIF